MCIYSFICSICFAFVILTLWMTPVTPLFQCRHSKIPLFSLCISKRLGGTCNKSVGLLPSNPIKGRRLLAEVITKHTKNGIQSTGVCCMKGSGPTVTLLKNECHNKMIMETWLGTVSLILSKSRELCALEFSYHHACLERLQDSHAHAVSAFMCDHVWIPHVAIVNLHHLSDST